jgi:hypothetical protein
MLKDVPPNLCKDCASYGGEHGYMEVCNDPLNLRWDYVQGVQTTSTATWLRDTERDDTCGAEGRWWKPNA